MEPRGLLEGGVPVWPSTPPLPGCVFLAFERLCFSFFLGGGMGFWVSKFSLFLFVVFVFQGLGFRVFELYIFVSLFCCFWCFRVSICIFVFLFFAFLVVFRLLLGLFV